MEVALLLPAACSKKIYNDYILGETLGTGHSSKVKVGTNKLTKEQVAVKIIDKSRIGKPECFLNEINILRQLNHPNIISLKDMYESDKKVYLIMELLLGGELFDAIVDRGSYSEKDASEVIAKVLSATKYLHERGIVHRDLKPENLIYASKEPDAEIKIADFGMSKLMTTNNAVLMTACGTPGYVAPEVIRKKGYSKAVDMWSIGVILYIMLCGFPPFYADSDVEVFQQILECRLDFPPAYWDSISPSAKHLVSQLIQANPGTRFTVDEALRHPWIAGMDAPSNDLRSTLGVMKALNSRRKFKKGIQGTIAALRFIKIIGSDFTHTPEVIHS